MIKRPVLLLTTAFLLLTTNVFADIKIYCPKCYRHLFNYVDNDIRKFHVEHLEVIPFTYQEASELINKGIFVANSPSDFTCSFDNAPLNGWKYWFWSRGLKEPRMAYPAMTVWTVVDGKFRWYPDEVEME